MVKLDTPASCRMNQHRQITTIDKTEPRTNVSYQPCVDELFHRCPSRRMIQSEIPVDDLLLSILLSREGYRPVHEIEIQVVEFEIAQGLSQLDFDLLRSVERIPELFKFHQHLLAAPRASCISSYPSNVSYDPFDAATTLLTFEVTQISSLGVPAAAIPAPTSCSLP